MVEAGGRGRRGRTVIGGGGGGREPGLRRAVIGGGGVGADGDWRRRRSLGRSLRRLAEAARGVSGRARNDGAERRGLAAEPRCCAGRCAGDVTTQVALQPALKFNGGGHINHTIFWTNLSPNGGGEPKGELLEAIKRDFGSFEKFKEKLTAVSVGVQGSGWGWLGFDQEQGRLRVAACSNQDPLQGTTGLVPLLGIDVWEHAYYLQYKNVRPDYLKAIWNVINWENVTERYQACKK
uniref:Superoxide dismutase n=1 Tax=Ornithorhynchus anatinus TaxID=9258 RepID=A0A6I8NDP4_ORNAN